MQCNFERRIEANGNGNGSTGKECQAQEKHISTAQSKWDSALASQICTNPLTSLFFSLNPLKMVLECEFCFCRFFSCCHFQFYFLLGFFLFLFLFPSFFEERKLFLLCCRVLSSLLCIHLSCQNYLFVYHLQFSCGKLSFGRK